MEPNLKNKLRESLFFLKGVEEGAAEEFLDSLSAAKNFKKGDTVCTPEDKGIGLGIIVKGTVEVFAGERCVNMRRIAAPDVFGVACLFGGEEYVSTVRAASDAEVIFADQEKMSRLMSGDFAAAKNYIDFLSDKIRFLNRRIESFTAGSSCHALWDYLLSQSAENGSLIPPKNMSRLAKSLNMGRTSLYRAVEELENSGRLIRQEAQWIINK